MAKSKLDIIIPNYNDKAAIAAYLEDVVTACSGNKDWSCRIIVVDDGSTDGSATYLAELADQDASLTVISLVRNFGQQTALYIGLEQSTAPCIVTIDGDGQYPASLIFKLAQAVKDGADMASGVREGRRDPLLTRLSSKIGNFMIQRILGWKIKDFGAAKAFSRPLALRILSLQNGSYDVYPAALFWRPVIAEIPFTHLKRETGRSKWSFSDRLKLYFDLYFKYGRDRFGFIFKLGILAVLLALAGTVGLLAYKILLGHVMSVTEILVSGFMGFAVGSGLILWSLLASALKQVAGFQITDTKSMISDISRVQKSRKSKEG